MIDAGWATLYIHPKSPYNHVHNNTSWKIQTVALENIFLGRCSVQLNTNYACDCDAFITSNAVSSSKQVCCLYSTDPRRNAYHKFHTASASAYMIIVPSPSRSLGAAIYQGFIIHTRSITTVSTPLSMDNYPAEYRYQLLTRAPAGGRSRGRCCHLDASHYNYVYG